MGQSWMRHLVLLSIISAALMRSTPHIKIMNGQQAYLGELPYMAVLHYQHGICSASIITQYWVTTAAHCTLEEEVRTYQVVAGIIDLRLVGDKAQMRRVGLILNHPNYTSTDFEGNAYFDISLVKVKEPFEWNEYVKPISLQCTYESYDPGQCFAAGFGGTKDGALRWLLIQSRVTSCEQLNSALSNLDHHICYGIRNFGAEHLLEGDFGGPLVCNGQSVGVATTISYPPVAEGDSEAIVQIHTSITHCLDWIEEYTDYFAACYS